MPITEEPITVITVNWEQNWEGYHTYKELFKFPHMVIKNRDENYGIIQELVSQGVITAGAYMANTNGKIQTASFTLEWQKLLKP